MTSTKCHQLHHQRTLLVTASFPSSIMKRVTFPLHEIQSFTSGCPFLQNSFGRLTLGEFWWIDRFISKMVQSRRGMGDRCFEQLQAISARARQVVRRSLTLGLSKLKRKFRFLVSSWTSRDSTSSLHRLLQGRQKGHRGVHAEALESLWSRSGYAVGGQGGRGCRTGAGIF